MQKKNWIPKEFLEQKRDKIIPPHDAKTEPLRQSWQPFRSCSGRKYEGLSKIGSVKEENED